MAVANSAGELLQLNRSHSGSFTSRLITFQDVPANFPHGHEIVAYYTIENNYRCRTRDYVAIFRKGWSDPRTYITFSWAPRHAKPNTPSSTRCVRFHSDDLNPIEASDDDYYEFVYVTKKKEIGGVSGCFTIGASWYNDSSSSSSSVSNVSDQPRFVAVNEAVLAATQSVDAAAGDRNKKDSADSFEMVEKTPRVASNIVNNLTQDLAPLISSLSQLGQDMFKIAVENSSSHVECRCTTDNGATATCTLATSHTSSSCGSIGSTNAVEPVVSTEPSPVTARSKSPPRRLYSQVTAACQEFAGTRPESTIAAELQAAAADEASTTPSQKVIHSSSQTISATHRATQMDPEHEPKSTEQRGSPTATVSSPRVSPPQQRKSTTTTPTFGQPMAPVKLSSMYESLRLADAIRERRYTREMDESGVRERRYSREMDDSGVRERRYSREMDDNGIREVRYSREVDDETIRERSYGRDEDEKDEGKRTKMKSGDSILSDGKAAVDEEFNVRRQKSSTGASPTTPESSICGFDTHTLGLPSFTLTAAPQKCARNLREMFWTGSAKSNTVTVSVKSKYKCKDCRKKMVNLRSLRARVIGAENTIAQLRGDMEEIENTLSLKDILLDELSCQLKNLLHENNRLVAANERLYSENQKLASLPEENARLMESEEKSAAAIKELQDKVTLLESEKEALMSLVTQYNTAMEELMEQAKVAETRLRGRQEEHQALQKQLDDVMYTMAQQGYTKMIDANGNSIDLTTKNGTPLQLKGGVGSASKEDTERYLATIASQEDAITSLHEECNSLRPQIGVAGKKVAQLEHMLQEERDSVNKLQRQIVGLMDQVSLQRNKESALSKLLVNEQKEKAELLQRHQEYQAILSERIRNLKDALQSEQLLSLHKQMALLCERCSGACAANADLSSTSETALLQPQRPARKMSVDAPSCCENWSNVDTLIQEQLLPASGSSTEPTTQQPTTPAPTQPTVKPASAKTKPKCKGTGNVCVSYAAMAARLPKELTTESKSDHQCRGDIQPNKETEAPPCEPPRPSHPAMMSSRATTDNSGRDGRSCDKKQPMDPIEEALQQIRASPDDKPTARVIDDTTTNVGPSSDRQKLRVLPAPGRPLKPLSTRSRKSNAGAKSSPLECPPRAYATPAHAASGTSPSTASTCRATDPNVPTDCPICRMKFRTNLTMEQFLRHLKQHNTTG